MAEERQGQIEIIRNDSPVMSLNYNVAGLASSQVCRSRMSEVSGDFYFTYSYLFFRIKWQCIFETIYCIIYNKTKKE